MKKVRKQILFHLFALIAVLGIGLSLAKQEVHAGQFDDAVSFYNTYGSGIVFKDGYYYYATSGKAAGASVNTIHWGTIGYRMRIEAGSQTAYIYFNRSGSTVEMIHEVGADGYIYNLYRINLSYVKSKLASANRTAYNEFLQSGGNILVDSCMVTIHIDGKGNRTESGAMDDAGNFYGSVYTDYNGIANAAPWANPSSLQSYFNKTINYVTQLKLRQKVSVRYQNADGSYGDYSAVINRDYVYGETVSWKRKADACYKEASISYTALEEKTSKISVERNKYIQNVYVKYMDQNGNYGGWILKKSKSVRYGATFQWSYRGDECYNGASVNSYTVKGAKDHYIYVSRKKYGVSVQAGTGIESVSGAGTYYYGSTCTIDAVVKKGYTWTGWTGSFSSGEKRYSFLVKGTVTQIANARANTYTITFHPNGGSGTMESIICQYDQTYTLPSMVFMPPTHPCTYLGWNTDSSSFSASYGENQQIRNLTDIDGYTFDFYAIWDYAPDLECKNRYFTLYEARHGMITEAELLRTAASTDREDGTTMIRVKDYSEGVFTSMSASTEIIITYTTTDSRHNITEKRAVVSIVDTENTAEGPMDFDGRKKYARFIDGEYWQNSYEHGGLEETSRWRQDVTYRDTLAFAMNNVRGEDGEYQHVQQTWEFTWEEIGQVKQFVDEKGMGNLVDGSALMQFVARFGGCGKS